VAVEQSGIVPLMASEMDFLMTIKHLRLDFSHLTLSRSYLALTGV